MESKSWNRLSALILLNCQIYFVNTFHQITVNIKGALESISSTFYPRIFCTKCWCQKLSSWLLGLKFWQLKFCTKNKRENHWWNWHLTALWFVVGEQKHTLLISLNSLNQQLISAFLLTSVKIYILSWWKKISVLINTYEDNYFANSSSLKTRMIFWFKNLQLVSSTQWNSTKYYISYNVIELWLLNRMYGLSLRP